MYNTTNNNSKIWNSLSLRLGTVLVTGGAGFIGSHIVENLLSKGVKVKVLDNLSSGSISFLSEHFDNERFCFLHKDLSDPESTKEALEDVKTVFHMAAYPEVRTGFEDPETPYNNNIRNTFNLLEQVRKSKVETFLFPSSSTIYGEPEKIPTSEDYGPLIPISLYGTSKIACEVLISSYCYSYGINGYIFRLANVIGSRSRHGVIWDFIRKLQNNNNRLEIMGNGLQSKSYIHIVDCIKGIFFCLTDAQVKKRIEIFNVGSEDRVDVISIAKIVRNTMNLRDVELVTQDPVSNDGRGWIGDVKHMHLDISKLKKLGWKPQFSSIDAVTLASKELIDDLNNLNVSKKQIKRLYRK
jgi:UDP-glucose 4-epimerase